MESFAWYLLKSSVWLTALTLFYVLFLRNERFFVLNRIYLISGILVSGLFPLLTWHYSVVLPVAPDLGSLEPRITGTVSIKESFPIQSLLLGFYLAGVLYALFHVIRQSIAALKVIRTSEVLQYHSAKLIRSNKYPDSFSFFSFVFVNPSAGDPEIKEIVNHELEHIRQQHWIDLLLFEILFVIQWFNPASWLYGRFIRQNHEYLADRKALERTSNPAVYRAVLLNQIFNGPVIKLANSFNYKLNKKRFNMMKQTKNPPVRKLRLLLVLPLMSAVFYAFAVPEYKFVIADGTSSNEQIDRSIDGRTVTGRVTGERGNPLKGATVVISGTTTGTTTDANGNFKLDMTDDTPLVISFIGFVSQKLKPDFGKEMFITMQTNTIGLEFGEESSQTEMEKLNPENMKPVNEIRIIDTKESGNEARPLIVVDGVIAESQNVDDIDPQTIESISVLKDEASTAVYGEKGKNGVILITLKSKELFVVVEEMPEFKGGINALKAYIVANLIYPAKALEKGVQGRVTVKFVVGKSGSIQNAAISRGIDPSLDKEALRIVRSMPDWKPGKQRGEAVEVSYEIPVDFILPQKN